MACDSAILLTIDYKIEMPTMAMSPEDRAHRIFATLYATSILWQLVSVLYWPMMVVHSPSSLIGVIEMMLCVTAFLVIAKPSKLALFPVLLVLQLVDAFLLLPEIPNHRLIFSVMSLGVLLSTLIAEKRFGRVRSGELYHLYAPVGRWLLLVLYFFAVLGKLNTDFLDPQVSCATEFYLHSVRFCPLFPNTEWARALIPYFAFGTEGVVALLLLNRRTRGAAVLIGMAFHILLSTSIPRHFYDFTSVMFTLFSTFVPPRIWEEAASAKGLPFWPRLHTSTALFRVLLLLCMFSIIVVQFWSVLSGDQELWYFYRYQIWFPFAVVLFLLAVGVIKPWRIQSERIAPMLSISSPVLIGLVCLAMLNGFAPYLGLKTRSSWDMYTNLRIENGQSNHLFMPPSLNLLGVMSDLVRVIDTSDTDLKNQYVGKGMLMTYFEFRSYASQHPEMSVVYLRGGKLYRLARASDDPELVRPIWMPIRKLLWFRPVDTEVKSRCQW